MTSLLCAFASLCLLGTMLLLLMVPLSVQQRTRKASKASVERIKRLIDERAQREFAQQDAVVLAEPIGRNPLASRHHDELAVNDPDGEYLQGDLELADWQAEWLRRKIEGEQDQGRGSQQQKWEQRRRKRKIGRRWDRRRPICFDIAESVPERTRQQIRAALHLWERHTCLRFHEGGPDVDRLEFFDGGGCSSFVGRAGGTQGVSIATPGCNHVGIIAHEVGHALGTFHEQARPDQQRHIAVHYNNIPVSRWNNFQAISDDQAATFGLPYDAGSVMHYGPFGFAADQWRPTISTLDKHWQSTIGQRGGPSFLDFQAINRAYNCAEHCAGVTGPGCQHGGYRHPNDCTKCQCPNGLGGPLCDAVQPSPCGATIRVSSAQGQFIGGDGPSHLPAGQSCYWLLRAPPGGHVHLQFVGDQFFAYPCEDTCDRAFVELKTGPDFRVTGYRFCCASAPAATFRSAGPEMVVLHQVNGAEEHNSNNDNSDQWRHGFRARIWSEAEWPVPTTTIATTTMTVAQSASSEQVVTSTGRTTAEERPTTERSSTETTTEQVATSEETAVENGVEVEQTTTATSEGTAAPPLELTTEGTTTPFPALPSSTSLSSSSAAPTPLAECSCQEWSAWSDCSQMCGGCGRRTRRRQCTGRVPPSGLAPLCQTEERRMCNQGACPPGTNFLFNNGEIHLLWKGCCVGLFLRNSTATKGNSPFGECGPLDNSENAFLRIISSLLSAQDAKEGRNSSSLLLTRRTGEH